MTTPLPAVFGVTSAFEVEFVDDVGVTRKGPLAGLWSTRFELEHRTLELTQQPARL
jgi:hypothetical protein